MSILSKRGESVPPSRWRTNLQGGSLTLGFAALSLGGTKAGNTSNSGVSKTQVKPASSGGGTGGGGFQQKTQFNPFQYAKESGTSSQSPGKDWVWKGNGDPGSPQGNWVNTKTQEKIHADLQHGPEKGPHYQYTFPGSKDSIDINLEGKQINNKGDIIGEPIPWD